MIRTAWSTTTASITCSLSTILMAPRGGGCIGASRPAVLFEQILKVPMISLPITNYDDNQRAENENLRVQNLWDGIGLCAALLTSIGRTWRGPVP